MIRRADCYENAVAESAVRTIKEEALGLKVREMMDDARRAVFAFSYVFCNQERLHSTLGYRTTSEIENLKMSEKSKER
jgi:hypothetical protein